MGVKNRTPKVNGSNTKELVATATGNKYTIKDFISYY